MLQVLLEGRLYIENCRALLIHIAFLMIKRLIEHVTLNGLVSTDAIWHGLLL